MGGADRWYHADTTFNLPQVYVSHHEPPIFNSSPHTLPVPDGAGLFYTTTQPTTLNVLRQYALHLLFVPPAPTSEGLLDGATAPARNPFPFVHKPNTLDRDRIVVPAGWDSWGKIGVLRDGFDAKAWGEAWERDLSFDAGAAGADGESELGARKLYASLVPDQGAKVRIRPDPVVCTYT
jgi:dynein light intermediate chain 1, cytosolic